MAIIKSDQRGRSQIGWLDSRHSFSFGEYYNSKMMAFSTLRVINEDRVKAGAGFPVHGHRDMEIISYVVAGELKHEDSMGHKRQIRPGELQVMSAGTGIQHSEMNGSHQEDVHFLQIWILPSQTRLKPTYAQKDFSSHLKTNAANGQLTLLASHDGEEGSLLIHQRAKIWGAKTASSLRASWKSSDGKALWLQNISGNLTVNGELLTAGDAYFALQTNVAEIESSTASEFLVFELESIANSIY